MKKRLLPILATVLVVIVLISVSCMKNAKHEQTSPSSGFQPQADVAASLEMAIKEIRKAYELNKPYELNARVSATGEWVFTFSFLPKTPGDEIIAIVGTNGVAITPGI